MEFEYTIEEAGKKFPELIRKARKGYAVTITCEGKPVAEIQPVERDLRENLTAEEWFEYLLRIGVLKAQNSRRKTLKPIATVPGGLDRFLAERWGEDADQWRNISKE